MGDTPSYNLVDEPWIRAIALDGSVKEFSLLEIFREAVHLKCLANDLPTQDFAILRVLLAILQRALSPWVDSLVEKDEDVEPAEVWGKLWQADGLPMKDIESYLGKWHDCFDLFDDEHPFMQMPGLHTTKNEFSSVSKIIADVPDGAPLFSLRSGDATQQIAYSEAARWLIHVQAFDTAGIKSGCVGDPNVKRGKSYPIGTGWSGYLGGLFLEGASLRDTLLRNLGLWGMEDSELFPDDDIPAWEQSELGFGSDRRVPTGQADVFTWQSRRVRLIERDGFVAGVVLTNGDKLDAHNQFKVEPMTAWRRAPNQEKRLGRSPLYLPRAHKSGEALWRGLRSLFTVAVPGDEPSATIAPRIISWLGYLIDEGGNKVVGLMDNVIVHGVGFEYGTQSSIVNELVDDKLELSPFLFSHAGSKLALLAIECVSDTDSAIKAFGDLAANLEVAAGGDQHDVGRLREAAKAKAYFEVDSLFRAWLARLGPNTEPRSVRNQWRRQVRQLLWHMGEVLVQDAGPRAVIGASKGKQWITAARAQAWFNAAVKKRLPLEEDAEDGNKVDERKEEANGD